MDHKTRLWISLMFIGMVFTICSTGYAEDTFLVFPGGNSESAIEEQVGAYLQKEHDLNVNYKKVKSNPEDVYLLIFFGLKDPVPDLTVIIDSQVWKRDPTTKAVSGRKIKIKCYRRNSEDGGMWKNKQAIILNEINRWFLKKSYFGSCYVDDDGDLIIQSFVPVVSDKAPVHIEQVDNLITNAIKFWIAFHKELSGKGILPTE